MENQEIGLTQEEHSIILKELEKKWLGKKTPDDTEIIEINVDYRKSHQHMNRVSDEYGNVFFISELEEYYEVNTK